MYCGFELLFAILSLGNLIPFFAIFIVNAIIAFRSINWLNRWWLEGKIYNSVYLYLSTLRLHTFTILEDVHLYNIMLTKCAGKIYLKRRVWEKINERFLLSCVTWREYFLGGTSKITTRKKKKWIVNPRKKKLIILFCAKWRCDGVVTIIGWCGHTYTLINRRYKKIAQVFYLMLRHFYYFVFISFLYYYWWIVNINTQNC